MNHLQNMGIIAVGWYQKRWVLFGFEGIYRTLFYSLLNLGQLD